MDIKPVYNNQVVFQGTVDKSLVKYINRAVTNECQTILDNANKSGVMVDEKALKACKQYADGILKSYSDYMAQLHPKSVLSLVINYSKLCPKTELEISNPVVKGCNIYLHGTDWQVPKWRIMDFGKHKEIITDSLSYFDDYLDISKIALDELDAISRGITNVSPIEIDKAFLNMAAEQLKRYANGSWFGRIMARINAPKVNRYAVDIGESPHFISRVSHWINKASEAKQNAKDIKARNNKIVNDILNS